MYIDIHVLQTVPPSNLNRDDTGAPKSAVYGGARRARVSSQAWKRATRETYSAHAEQFGLRPQDLGVRTKRAVELLTARISDMNPELKDEAEARANKVVTALGLKVEKPAKAKTSDVEDEHRFGNTSYLVFWSNRQLDRLAELAISEVSPTKKQAAAALDSDHGIDVALFGRMVAEAADYNVDAAVQVAHAISTHKVEIEQDYYTAVDDNNPKGETGAGMIGTVEFNAATLYRYATINVDGLQANLGGGETTARAASAFIYGFVTSMPTGKQNTFANRTLPDAVVLCVRNDQPVNLVGAFEEAVEGSSGFVEGSAKALAQHAREVAAFLSGPAECVVARTSAKADALDTLGETVNLEALVGRAGDAVRRHTSAS